MDAHNRNAHAEMPRRILMTADTVGGVWTYALELARSLATHNVEVFLATLGPELTRAQAADARSIPNLSLFKSNYKLEWMEDCWQDVRRAGHWLLHLEGRLNPDVVHLNSYAHAALPWRVPCVVVGHSCVLSWCDAVKGDCPSHLQFYKQQVTRGLHAANIVVAPTQAMMNALNRHYGPLINGRVIANGRNPVFFKRASKYQFILSAGRLWDEAKNVTLLADVAGTLPWPVCIAGNTVSPDTASHSNGTNRVRNNCYLLGCLSDALMRRWYSDAAIYALPAKYEPFGYTPLEAGLSGCALVLGDIPSLREVWGEAAVFVKPDDGAALRAALLRLIEDQHYRDHMGQLAHSRALEFTHTRMTNEYLSIYAEVVHREMVKKKLEELAACA